MTRYDLNAQAGTLAKLAVGYVGIARATLLDEAARLYREAGFPGMAAWCESHARNARRIYA